MTTSEGSGGWDEVLDDLQGRRNVSRAMGGDERLAQAPRRRQARRPRARRPPARPRVVPGARDARRRRGRTGRRDRDGLRSHRRPPGDGRGRGLHGEGRHHQRGGELEALPGRRARGHRSRAVDHDARRRRVPGRRARSRRTHADRHARPGPVLRPGAARHGGPRRVGRSRRARRAAVGLHGDEPARVDLHRRPAGRARVDGRDDHEGGSRRSRRRDSQRTRPQRRRDRRGRARPRAHATCATSRRRRGRTRSTTRATTSGRGSSPRSSTSSRSTAGASTTCTR